MSQEQKSRIAQQLLAGIGEGADPDQIAALFSVDVQFEIAGDVDALPWIGRRTGRSAASDFETAMQAHGAVETGKTVGKIVVEIDD